MANKKKASNKEIKVLVVEDSPIQAEMLKRLLLREGYSVEHAENGLVALTLASEVKPDIILSDVLMPEMNGYVMCRKIKESKELGEIPVILLTTLTDIKDILLGLEAGADSYITKPYDEEYLLKKTVELLERTVIQTADGKAKGSITLRLAGEYFDVRAEKKQILNLLVSTYENALLQNKSLSETRDRLEILNRKLEENVVEIETSKRRFETLVETIPDIVYRIDTEGNFVYINDAIHKLGYKTFELIGKHFTEIMVPGEDEISSREKILKKYKGKETGDENAPKLFDERRTGSRKTTGLEVRLLMKGSKVSQPGFIENLTEDVIVTEVNSSGMYEVNPHAERPTLLGTVGVIRDITERKKTEQEMIKLQADLARKEAEAKYINLVEAATDAIVSTNANGDIIQWNKGAEKIFGYSKKEALGRPVTILIPEDERQKHVDAVKKYINTGESKIISGTIEKEGVRKDGSLIPIEMNLSVTKIKRNHHFTAIIRDVTERHQLQIQLEQKLADVERFNKLMVGREIKMGETREENERLKSMIEQLEKNIQP